MTGDATRDGDAAAFLFSSFRAAGGRAVPPKLFGRARRRPPSMDEPQLCDRAGVRRLLSDHGQGPPVMTHVRHGRRAQKLPVLEPSWKVCAKL